MLATMRKGIKIMEATLMEELRLPFGQGRVRSSDDIGVGGVLGRRKCAREAVPRASGNKISTLDECRQLVAGADAQQLSPLETMFLLQNCPQARDVH